MKKKSCGKGNAHNTCSKEDNFQIPFSGTFFKSKKTDVIIPGTGRNLLKYEFTKKIISPMLIFQI